MENNVPVEQSDSANLDIGGSSLVNQPSTQSDACNSDSTFGKFKDATSLLSAYDSLQAEFTRKSQKLSDAQRRIAELENLSNNSLAKNDDNGLLAKGNVGAVIENKQDNSSSALPNEQLELQRQNEKLLRSQNWKRKVDDFFFSNSDAKNYSLDMAKILKQYSGLRELDGALDISYALAKSKGLSEPAKLINDQNFISEFIMKNDKIKGDIIREYLLSVKEGESSPKLLSGSANTVYATPNQHKPTTIAEASKIVSKMFGTK